MESGGWPFGTERPSSHPSTRAPVERLFGLGLGESAERAHKAPSRQPDATPRAPREVTVAESDHAHGRVEADGSERATIHRAANPRTAQPSSEAVAPGEPSPALASGVASTQAASFAAPPVPADVLGAPQATLDSTTAAGGLPAGTAPIAAAVPVSPPTAARSAGAVATRGADASLAVRPVEAAGAAPVAATVAKAGEHAASATPARESAAAPDPEKAAEVFRQLRLQLTPGTRHAVIQLAPAELGRIAIRVSVKGGRVVGEIRAEREETLAILEKHVPELRSALAQTGFEATEFDLARHGDPSPRRHADSPLITPLSETGDRLAARTTAPGPIAPVLTADRVDLLA